MCLWCLVLIVLCLMLMKWCAHMRRRIQVCSYEEEDTCVPSEDTMCVCVFVCVCVREREGMCVRVCVSHAHRPRENFKAANWASRQKKNRERVRAADPTMRQTIGASH